MINPNCKYHMVIPVNPSSAVPIYACDAYSESICKDHRHWSHYPECNVTNCPLLHPDLLDGAILK